MGSAFATASPAMLLLPPVRFSTVTGWPHSFWSWSAIIRADRSTPPPAGEALMILIARVGKPGSSVCALACTASKAGRPDPPIPRGSSSCSREVSPAEMAASSGAVDLEFLPLQPQARLGTPNPKTASILKLSGRAAYTSGRGGRLAGKPDKIWVAVELFSVLPTLDRACHATNYVPRVADPASECPLQPLRFLGLDAGHNRTRIHRSARRRVGRVDERDRPSFCGPDAARAFIARVENPHDGIPTFHA